MSVVYVGALMCLCLCLVVKYVLCKLGLCCLATDIPLNATNSINISNLI